MMKKRPLLQKNLRIIAPARYAPSSPMIHRPKRTIICLPKIGTFFSFLVLLIFAASAEPLFVVVVAHFTHLDHLQISWHFLYVFLMLRSRSLLIIPKFQSIWRRGTTSSVKLVSDRMVRCFWEKRSSPGKGMLIVLL